MGDNKNIGLKMLFCKLVALLASTSAGRASKLNQLNVKFMSNSDTCIHLRFLNLKILANQRIFYNQLCLMQFDADYLCVVKCIRSYVKRTSSFREILDNIDRSWLLLSFVKPHHPVTTSSVFRWLKTIMTEAGINTHQFKAHSTRSLQFQKTTLQGCQYQILCNKHWAKKSTLVRIYCKPIHKSAF